MSESIFFRLLHTPIDQKGDALAARIAALNETGTAEEAYNLDPADLSMIPRSPFAYWASESIRRLFAGLPKVESGERVARIGDHPGNKDRYVRTVWEVPPSERSKTRQWLPYQKGGIFSPYYTDTHLVVDWDLDRETYYDFYGRPGRSSERPSNYQLFFRPGLNWPLRTQKGLNLRTMPAGCIISYKSPTVFVPDDDPSELLVLLAVMNSTTFKVLVELQMAFGSYEVGVIQRTPIPLITQPETRKMLSALAREAHDLQRDRDRTDETTHAFCLPGLVRSCALVRDRQIPASHGEARTPDGDLTIPFEPVGCTGSLLEAGLALEGEEQAAQARLAEIQAEIDDLAFDLYGLDEADRALVRAEMGITYHVSRFTSADSEANGLEAESNQDDEPIPPADLPARVQNLLMWCVGVAFGRWDVRMALDPTLLPALQGPFDPLPRCAPGAIVGPDGLPPARLEDIVPEAWLRARQDVLDLPPSIESPISNTQYPQVAWNGILVDDPTHPSDIVARVRGVLALLWGGRAGAVEREACEILGFDTLRDYLRDPRKGLFAFHVKRYSKSRRKAPIYWLLQSERRSYAVWLYIHRLGPDTLFAAGRDYADAKVALEQARLEELRAGLGSLDGSARRRRERESERQQRIVAEVTDFRDRLDRVALLKLPPDLNDGVTISIAPLWELVPWKEAQKMWDKLVAGEYPWSTMAQQMQKRGLVRE